MEGNDYPVTSIVFGLWIFFQGNGIFGMWKHENPPQTKLINFFFEK